MISFWHLTAVCCIPASNPEARLREQEIYRIAAADAAKHAKAVSSGRVRNRCGKSEARVSSKS